MLRGLMLGVLGLLGWAGACLAEGNSSGNSTKLDASQPSLARRGSADLAKSMIFDGIPTSGLGYILPDGREYTSFRFGLWRSGADYYLERRSYGKKDPVIEIESIKWRQILFDSEGLGYFGPNAGAPKESDALVVGLPNSSEMLLAYSKQMIGKGNFLSNAPRDLDRYKSDGVLVRRIDGKCDPLNNRTRISIADIDGELGRTREIHYDKSMLVLADGPIASSRGLFYVQDCPDLVAVGSEHDLRAVALLLYLFRVDEKYLLVTDLLPFGVVLDDLTRDFCAIVTYPDGAGGEKSIRMYYAASDLIDRAREGVPVSVPADPGESANERNTRINLMNYEVLSRALPVSDCAVIRK